MAFFKILKGASSRIGTDITPFDDGCAYFTPDDGGLYIDSEDNGEQNRIRINPKYDKHTVKNLVLLASGWVGVEAPYTQEILVGGLSAAADGIIAMSHAAMTDQRIAARKAMIHIIGQEDGKLIFAADGELPQFDIPASLILF